MLGCFLLVYWFSSAAGSELLSRHRRSWIIDSFTIEEEHPGPFPYALGAISIERNYGIYFQMFGEGVDKEPMGVLSIDEDSGTLYVHGPVDYEKKKLLRLTFEVRKRDQTVDTNLGIHIDVLDINDNPPLFQRDLYEITVNEDDPQGSAIMALWASDRDEIGSPNSTFHFEIKSVSPKDPDMTFFIDDSGRISFKGCLDHEVTETYTVLVEVKDHGEVVSLSSSTTVLIHVQDRNNHLPTILGQTGPSRVKEGETGTSPLRIHVTDRDSPNSPAWRARYSIHGDEQQNFNIETDPESNDGVLTVVKPLDFEGGTQRELSISVENELPYFSCKVMERTSSGLWKVDNRKSGDPDAAQLHSVKVVIEVEDVNDPPMFSVSVKEALLEENAPIGSWVERVTAVDPDASHAREFVYKVGHDPAGWLTIDPHTGVITTVYRPDRESPHVVDGIYIVLMHAVDNGTPAMTGTATLHIHVADQNDNLPQLMESHVEVCVSDTPTRTNLTAFDPDDIPFGGPFAFELLGDVEGKWNLDPANGYTAGLVKEQGVYAGSHTVDLKVSGMQGEFAVFTLSVTACDCSATPDCLIRRETKTNAFGAIGIIFASLFLLLVMLLMAIFMSCKKQFAALRLEDYSGDTLLVSNIETPGTDCKIYVPRSLVADKTHQDTANLQTERDGMQHKQVSAQQETQQHSISTIAVESKQLFSANMNQVIRQNIVEEPQQYPVTATNLLKPRSTLLQSWGSMRSSGYHHNQQIEDQYRGTSFHRTLSMRSSDAVRVLLHRRLTSLRETENELLDYEPNLYADEGDWDESSDFEDIIPDEDSFEEALSDLDPKFNRLGSICRKPQNRKVYSIKYS